MWENGSVKLQGLVNVFVVAVSLTACDWERQSDPAAPMWMGPEEVEADEEAIVREDVRRARERRRAFFESGLEPEVPSDLGRDIGAENLEFVGFANIGTEPVVPPEGNPGDTTCEDDLEAAVSLAETPVWGYFINPAGGNVAVEATGPRRHVHGSSSVQPRGIHRTRSA